MEQRWGDSWETQPRDSNGEWGSGGTATAVLDKPGSSTVEHPMSTLKNGEYQQLITSSDARGDSRPVSEKEFRALSAEGQQKLDSLDASQPTTGLDKNWDSIKANAYSEAQKSWGGVTIDAHTGQAVEPETGGNVKDGPYALTVKAPGMSTITVPENASQDDFNKAMDQAKQTFGSELAKGQRSLGVFHDDEQGRIDIDPVLVVNNLHDVETIGAYTHAIGGAYNFADGNGYFPPHVVMSLDEFGVT